MTFPRCALAAGLLAVACAAGAQTAARKTYIVQLADAPAATYAGTVGGLAATRPAQGAKFNARSANVRAYVGYLDSKRAAVLARAGNPKVVHRYDISFAGFSAEMTEAQAKALKSSAGVVSVTPSQIRKLTTISTPGFLGLTAPGGLWSKLDAASRNVKGEDVIIGVIDSGVWPEDTSFGDKLDANGKPVAYNQPGSSAYGVAPAKWIGVCQTGAGFTAAMCNNKLIGARYYVADFKASGAELSTFEYESPRDGGGHGSHTASTAGGNSNVDARIDGTPVGVMSGIAPRARIAAYKVCWEATTVESTGCYTADTLKAIDDAVADGVDVINFSVSGTQTNFLDPVEVAYLNATAAGIFVAASAGNAGPGNEVAHMSPWLMTVAASTHDRQLVADLTLGNGSVYTGASANTTALPSAPMVLSSDIPAAGVPVSDANLCFLNSLDPAKAAGKIVVCDRGTNARVEKSQVVQLAGGVGMVLINPTSNSLVADFHSVPTVHLQDTVRTAVRTYVATAGATGSISKSYPAADVVAPVMADFSSRGPNKANGNILKPDITGPGVDVIAGYLDGSLTQEQHDAVAAGNYTPMANAGILSGTSMSSPHVAGAAALLKQLYPSWSPAAIKSAMMTTTTDVKEADGTPDLDRWGYGAGHMNPNGSATPGLVYDAGPADHGRFLCGIGLTPPTSLGTCATLGSIQPWNLNLASLTAAQVTASLTMTRKVTNVSGASATFVSTASLPGFSAVVAPASLTLAPGATGEFSVTVTRTSAAFDIWSFGSLSWSDGVSQVRSPLSAKAIALDAPSVVTDTSASGTGSEVFNIVAGYTGSLTVVPTGLVPATRTAGTVATGQKQCFDFRVGPGAQVVRFALFNDDTQGGSATDLDLEVYDRPRGKGTLVGSSGSATSAETVTLLSPSLSVYSACVAGFNTPQGGAAFTLSSWVLGGPLKQPTSLMVSAPRSVTQGAQVPVTISWSVPAGKRYLGNLRYVDNSHRAIDSTLVVVDNH